MINTASVNLASNNIEPVDNIHSKQPVILSHEQESRVSSASDVLAELIESTKHAPVTGELYQGYADIKNPIGGVPSTQRLLYTLRRIRYIEQVLPFLDPSQRKVLIEINTYFIPLLLPIIAYETNGRNRQLLILDVLSLGGITSEQMNVLEGFQNELTAYSMAHPAYGIEQIKSDWTRFVD